MPRAKQKSKPKVPPFLGKEFDAMWKEVVAKGTQMSEYQCATRLNWLPQLRARQGAMTRNLQYQKRYDQLDEADKANEADKASEVNEANEVEQPKPRVTALSLSYTPAVNVVYASQPPLKVVFCGIGALGQDNTGKLIDITSEPAELEVKPPSQYP